MFKTGTREIDLLRDDNTSPRLLAYRDKADGSIFRYLHDYFCHLIATTDALAEKNPRSVPHLSQFLARNGDR